MKGLDNLVKQVCQFRHLEGPKDKEDIEKFISTATLRQFTYTPPTEEYEGGKNTVERIQKLIDEGSKVKFSSDPTKFSTFTIFRYRQRIVE